MVVNRALWFKVASACLGVAACGDPSPSSVDRLRDDVLVKDTSRDVTLQDGGDDVPEDDLSVETPMAFVDHAMRQRLSRRATPTAAW